MSRRLILALLVVAAASAALVFLTYLSDRSFDRAVEEAPKQPPGRWHRVPRPSIDRRADEVARLVSLPYLSGTRLAGNEVGVTAFHSERAFPGVAFYVSGHGPEAILLTLDGKVLHRWRFEHEKAFPELPQRVGSVYWRRAHLYPNGDILAIFQGEGALKLDRDSRLLWKIDVGLYNDLDVLGDGTIYSLGKEAQVVAGIQPENAILEDFVTVIDADGGIRDRISILKSFERSQFAHLLKPMLDEGDIFHTNTIEYLDGRLASHSNLFRRGNLLLSLREIDTLAILDPDKGLIVWAARGPWDAQHQPTLLDNGRILLFDNRGAAGETRLLEVDPLTLEIHWDYRGPQARPLSSPEAGSVARLPNGNTLITESEAGRAFEITPSGDIVWEFSSPHRTGKNNALVATLFEVLRLEPSAAGFLNRIGP